MNLVYFAIPVAARQEDAQWHRLSELLRLTLGSIFNQTSGRYKVLVCGQDKPEVLSDPAFAAVEFVQADFPAPKTDKAKRRDKRQKRWEIARRVRMLGGGYFMYMDADDLVHRDFVEYVTTHHNKVGYLIAKGYALDYANRLVAPIPGTFNKNFNQVCGSSGVVYMLPEDLPEVSYDDADSDILYSRIRNHNSFEDGPMREGKKLEAIPFPAGIYTLNNSLNLSNRLVRTEERQQDLVRAMRSLSLGDAETNVVAADFGLRAFLSERAAPLAEPSIRPVAASSASDTSDPSSSTESSGPTRMRNRLFSDCAKRLPNFSMQVVFDVGANIGQTTEGILEQYPSARVFAFEPVSATFTQFVSRFGGLPNVKANRLALSSTCTMGKVRSSGTSVGNSLTQKEGTADNPVEPVELITGDVYCAQNGIEHINYLKVDTEGFDLEVLKGFHRMIGSQSIDLLQVEASMNPFNKRHIDFGVFRGYLEACNYYLFGIYSQVYERKGRPILRRSNPVFISQKLVDASVRNRS